MVPAADAEAATQLLAQMPQSVSRPPLWMAAIFMALVWWCGAAPMVAGPYPRWPEIIRADGMA
ncbi:MAG: hypothetical protein ACK5LJ_13325 [Paracoccus sp. (in: a-proteobacteria)]